MPWLLLVVVVLHFPALTFDLLAWAAESAAVNRSKSNEVDMFVSEVAHQLFLTLLSCFSDPSYNKTSDHVVVGVALLLLLLRMRTITS